MYATIFFLLDRSMCTTFKCSLRNDSFFATLFSRAQCTYQQKQSEFSIKKLHLLEKRVLRVGRFIGLWIICRQFYLLGYFSYGGFLCQVFVLLSLRKQTLKRDKWLPTVHNVGPLKSAHILITICLIIRISN